MGIKIVYIFLIFERKWRAIPFSSIRIIYELCYQTHPSFFSFQIKRDDVFNNCKVVYTKPLSINTFQNVYNAFSLLIGTVHPAFHLLPTLVCNMFRVQSHTKRDII